MMQFPKPSGILISKTKLKPECRLRHLWQRDRKGTRAVQYSLERLRKSKSAFCLRSSEFGQDVDRAGIRSITRNDAMNLDAVRSNGQAAAPSKDVPPELTPDFLFHENRRLVWYFVWLLGRDYDDFTRDDLAQAGEIALWRMCQKYKPEWRYQFATYAGNSIKWAVLRERSRIRRFERQHAQHADRSETRVTCSEPMPVERVVALEQAQIIRDGVATLTDRQQSVVNSRLAGTKQSDVAREMNVSRQAVNQAFERGLQRLKIAIVKPFTRDLRVA